MGKLMGNNVDILSVLKHIDMLASEVFYSLKRYVNTEHGGIQL